MLHKFQFHSSIIHILMTCVTTTRTAIQFNNTRTPYFKPSRGLRQGDLLSLLFFVIYMECFTALINHAKQASWWVSYSLKQHINPSSYLAFGEDFILFTKATPQGIQGVKKKFSLFCQTYWQNVNLGKSKLLSNKFSNSFITQSVMN